MTIFKGISKPQDRKTSSFYAPLARSNHNHCVFIQRTSQSSPNEYRNSNSLLKDHCCTKNRTGDRSLETALRLCAACCGRHRASSARVSGNKCLKAPGSSRHPPSPRGPSDHVPLSRTTFPKYHFFWCACGAHPLYSICSSSRSSNSKCLESRSRW